LPLLSTWLFGSKVRLPLVAPYTILIGMMYTGTVVEVLPCDGGVPTMVYVTFFWVRSVKLPFHCTRLEAGALGASSMWFGPALNIGLASRMSGYLVSWAKATLAHASTRIAATSRAPGGARAQC